MYGVSDRQKLSEITELYVTFALFRFGIVHTGNSALNKYTVLCIMYSVFVSARKICHSCPQLFAVCLPITETHNLTILQLEPT